MMKTFMLTRADCHRLLSFQELLPYIRSTLKAQAAPVSAIPKSQELRQARCELGRINGIPAYTVNALPASSSESNMIHLYHAVDDQLLALMPAHHISKLSTLALAAYGSSLLAQEQHATIGIIGWNDDMRLFCDMVHYLRPMDSKNLLIYTQQHVQLSSVPPHQSCETVDNVDTILAESDTIFVAPGAAVLLTHAIFWRSSLQITLLGEKLPSPQRAFRQPVQYWHEQKQDARPTAHQLHELLSNEFDSHTDPRTIHVLEADRLSSLELAAAWQIYKKGLYYGYGQWMDFIT
ncbi:hypothetical protein G4V62_17210 [Bacillaceae bacterium SIJ1]|uniref:hypothetical protein n=1 Tax=Litoribacterium kuwaitense TaxID=1398745 RepID=UPI0013EC1ED0|nr:hypothetical protein [Litoribacterium kuwaitense]NGP46598.1 hypothetical protein [Litoribacterium kuwaitense]